MVPMQEEIKSHLQGFLVMHAPAQGRRQHMGQPHSGHPRSGEFSGVTAGVEEGQMGGQPHESGRVWWSVVDHLQRKPISHLQGLDGGHPVIDGDEQCDPLARQALHHGGIE